MKIFLQLTEIGSLNKQLVNVDHIRNIVPDVIITKECCNIFFSSQEWITVQETYEEIHKRLKDILSKGIPQ